MVLEATMICIDNSEWMRSGDYSPSRLQAQADAVNLICGAKTLSNPGNTVGILTMAGGRVRVLTTPTSDLGKIFACMHGIEAGGEMNIASGIQVAQLALKHRQDKNQQQRIIVFAGSPIKYEKKALEIIGKKLKKSNVSLDIINFGDEDDGKPEKLEALLSAVNNNDSSHIIHVPPGPNALADVLISTPVFTGDEGAGYAAAGGDFDFLDPYFDPELELAIRVYMEEQIARQEAVAKWALEEFYSGEASSNSQDATMVDSTIVTAAKATDTAPDGMEEVLQLAFEFSMQSPGSDPSAKDVDMSDAVSDDKDLAIAFQMSMQDDQGALSGQSDMSKVLEDQAFMSSILASLPGVDQAIALLASLRGQSEPEEKKNEDKPPNDDK